MATKKNKKNVKQSMIQNNIAKITKAAATINSQLTDTVGELVEDAKANGQVLSKMASTSTEELQIRNSLGKVVKTAKVINAQVVETATDVLGDVVATAKNTITNIDVKENLQQIKTVASNANEYALTTAEDIVKASVKNGEQMQDIANKAIKGGLHLAERQQDIVFNTLETVKDQLTYSSNRLKNIFSKN